MIGLAFFGCGFVAGALVVLIIRTVSWWLYESRAECDREAVDQELRQLAKQVSLTADELGDMHCRFDACVAERDRQAKLAAICQRDAEEYHAQLSDMQGVLGELANWQPDSTTIGDALKACIQKPKKSGATY
jgi:hypothetical protein